ncbi:hypothetical protein MTR67_022800 [Solanum verrucosum]|uniref:Uncharacterized protein n=1 Tax=Solanum verrucosum TaxID=315347 RepID=A0AAF0QYI4_SOLVR|nr:hypothetical protein MTR67_022800 [Solanum verrucosum]
MENQSDNSDEKPSSDPMSESATVLDLTSFQLHDLDSVELPPSLTELDLTTNRLSALDPRIGQLPNLKKLSLRQNLITDAAVEPLSSWQLISHLEGILEDPTWVRQHFCRVRATQTATFYLTYYGITFDGVKEVICKMRWGRAIGPDEIPVEFWKTQKKDLFDLVVSLFLSSTQQSSKLDSDSSPAITKFTTKLGMLFLLSYVLFVLSRFLLVYRELVLRDNQLKKVPDVVIFKKLLVFDVSFNEISSLSGLSKVSSTLRELYVSKNEVTKMEEIEHFYELQILELGSNRLRIMELLENLKNLQELWLGRNRIRTVNLCGLKCIKKISLQSNRLTSMIGFQECVALEELYLSHNGIVKMEGLSTLVNLRVLDVSANKLTEINDIENLTKLEDLWLNDNNIASLEGLEEAVTDGQTQANAQSPNYVSTLRQIFPNIEQIDSEVYA